MRDRNWSVFSEGIEFDLFFVRGSKLTSLLSAGRNYVFLMHGSKLAWLLCAGRKLRASSVGIDWLGCCVGDRNRLDFSVGDQNWLWFQFRDRNWLGFCVGIETDLSLARVSNFLCWGSKLILLCSGRWSLGCHAWIDFDLVLVRGSRLIRCFCAGRKWLVFNLWIHWLGFCLGVWTWHGFCLGVRT